ncbi:hypothetical protein B9Y66_06310 [Stenotrophomonas maltophilia]|nr:hypothetical protein B9Y66_06310 [Stenotrophomonas maltophilia]
MIACPKSRFVLELENLTPAFTAAPIMHANFATLWRYLKTFTSLSNGGDIILIVGPSNNGKSQLLGLLTKHIREALYPFVELGHVPIIGAKANPSRDSRMTPKQLIRSLLEDGGHPLSDPQRREQAGFYPTQRGLSEEILLGHLTELLVRRGVRYVLIDEGQAITRTKDPMFAATLMESLKSLAGSDRNLIVCGGYDLLEPALSVRSHLAARTIVLHLAPYKLSTGLTEWKRILKTLSKNTNLEGLGPALNASAEMLLAESNGCVGVLERRLKDTLAWCAAHGTLIDSASLAERRPTKLQWEVQRKDIADGLDQLHQVAWGAGAGREITLIGPSEVKRNAAPRPSQPTKRQRPFQRKPDRFPGMQ